MRSISNPSLLVPPRILQVHLEPFGKVWVATPHLLPPVLQLPLAAYLLPWSFRLWRPRDSERAILGLCCTIVFAIPYDPAPPTVDLEAMRVSPL